MITIKNYLFFIVTIFLLNIKKDYSATHEQMLQKNNDCHTTKGKALVHCLQSLPYDNQKKTFKELTPQERKDYLKNLSLEDYEKFLDNYNEYEWQRLYTSLTKTEQTHWPRSIQEQRIALAKIADEACNGSLSYQRLMFGLELIPLGKSTAQYLGTLCTSDKISLPNKITRAFHEYMNHTFEL